MYPAPPVTRVEAVTSRQCTVRRVIAAVVVTFSAPAEILDRCLRALIDHGGLDRIVVVDTGGAAVVAPDLGERVELTRMDNRGYGAAANRGFEALDDADRIALLNDDVVVAAGWLEPLADALSAPTVVAIPKSRTRAVGCCDDEPSPPTRTLSGFRSRWAMPRACRYPGVVPLAKQVIQVAWLARNSQRLSAYWYPALLGERYRFYFEDPCRTRFQGDCRNADPCHHPNIFFESQIAVATFEVAFQQPTRPLSR